MAIYFTMYVCIPLTLIVNFKLKNYENIHDRMPVRISNSVLQKGSS